MSVTAGIPLFVDTTWEVSAEQTFEYSYGESYSETIEVRFVVVCLSLYWIKLLRIFVFFCLILVMKWEKLKQPNFRVLKLLHWKYYYVPVVLYSLFLEMKQTFNCKFFNFNIQAKSMTKRKNLPSIVSAVTVWRLKWQFPVNIPVEFLSWLVRWWQMFPTMQLSLFISLTSPPQQST